MTAMELIWKGPFKLGENLADLNSETLSTQAGVYLWEKARGNYIGVYFGRANNVLWRIREHICHLLGGFYTIYDENGAPWYVPDGKKSTFSLDSLNNVDQFSFRALQQAKTCEFYFASCDPKVLSTCEALLIQAFKPKGRFIRDNTRVESYRVDVALEITNRGVAQVAELVGESLTTRDCAALSCNTAEGDGPNINGTYHREPLS